ncbi:uncharacterized protein C2orf72-like [Hemicordylus capensis]|uniref:uncharacterized protein C2orf72-like n=1 Tax=Hemicordylus capensis TaxID=884348 RepID=UPI0023024E9C|nr:uncharacterized protein C2orf72-like [Hemicordylus capensis]
MSTEGPCSGKPAPKAPPEAPTCCAPLSGQKVLQDFQILVHKVGGRPEVLLVGETLEGKDIYGHMASFVRDLFSAPCHPVSPADALKEPCAAPCSLGGKQCQLIFFLCRASCLKSKPAELRRVLKELKRFVQQSPCAVVGILTDPTKGEAEEARDQLLRMLRGVFPKAPASKRGRRAAPGKRDLGTAGDGKGRPMELEDVEVEAEVYVPGYPRGNLAIMKAACRASAAVARGSSWTSILVKSLLGTVLVAGMASAAGWYFYDQGMIPPDLLPGALFASA